METAGTVRTFLVFLAADRACAIDTRFVQEVQPLAALSRPPGLPPLMAGFLWLGGAAVPVIPLARLFGLEDDPPGMFTPLVILRGGDTLTAVQVSRLVRIVRVWPDAMLPLPRGHVFRDCAAEGFAVDDRVACVLWPDRLLLEAEARRLAELRHIEELRQLSLEGAAA